MCHAGPGWHHRIRCCRHAANDRGACELLSPCWLTPWLTRPFPRSSKPLIAPLSSSLRILATQAVPPLAGEAPIGAAQITVEDSARAGPVFRTMVLVTVFTTYGLVVLGGAVRLTDSGLACPDWPLCHGELVPPMEKGVIIEYSHRLMASLVGVFVVVVSVAAWRHYRAQRWIVVSSTLAVAFLAIQVLLGGFTVIADLSPKIVVAHLGVAMALLACLTLMCVATFAGPIRRVQHWAPPARLWIIAGGAAVTTYALMITGSYVASSGSTAACGQGWPLCAGSLVPDGHQAAMHMVHRLISLGAGVLILTTAAFAWRRIRHCPALGISGGLMGVMFIAQIVVGASILWMGFPLEARLIHLAMGALVWIALATIITLSIALALRQHTSLGVNRA